MENNCLLLLSSQLAAFIMKEKGKGVIFLQKWVVMVTVLVLSLASVTWASGSRVESRPNIAGVSDVSRDLATNDDTFILKDIVSGETVIFNNERAVERQSPFSTFKIMNALIGLQVKAVKDEYDIKYWDGTDRGLTVWNRDHTLGSAMRYSVVWYYQAMARDIGEQRMQEWLDKCSYGNRDISGGIDRFWLNSSLQISPLEQVDFLERLYNETLPFDKSVMKTVKRMMIQQEEPEYTLYGKTGSSALGSDGATGWYVGYVVVKGHPFVFVTNLHTQEAMAGQLAKKRTLDILQGWITNQ